MPVFKRDAVRAIKKGLIYMLTVQSDIKISLTPMEIADKETFYQWATRSFGGCFWYGHLYNTRVPSRREFFADWKDYYFRQSEPMLGRCFKIIVDDRAIGQVNYNAISPATKTTELDILIASEKDMNKGYGRAALKSLMQYLFDQLQVKKCEVNALVDNPRAITAYQYAGFRPVQHYDYNERQWVKLQINREGFYGL